MWKSKQNKPFIPQFALGHGVLLQLIAIETLTETVSQSSFLIPSPGIKDLCLLVIINYELVFLPLLSGVLGLLTSVSI